MGFFDSLGNFASRIGREALKGVGAIGEFAGNIAGGAWSSMTDPGFNLPTTGGLGGKIGGLIGEFGEQMVGSMISPAGVPMGPQTGGYPRGYNPDPRAQRDLEIFLGRSGAPQPGSIPFEMGGPMQTGEMMGVTAPYGGEMMSAVALPGGALIGSVLRQIPGVLGGAALGMQYSGGQSLDLPYGGTIFRQTSAGLRARSLVEVVNPITGKKSWYRNVGRPILFSGDLRSCRRVRKIAGRARRARGR